MNELFLKKHLIPFIAAIILFSACVKVTEEKRGTVIREVSGIARVDDKLLIVGDDADGRYFELPLEGHIESVIPIDPFKVKEVPLPGAELAMDLEGIDMMADGRVALLSEQLRCLIAKKKIERDHFAVIAEYDRTVTEFGNRGLEGLAIKMLDNKTSRIAVLWEGGYPISNLVPKDLRQHAEKLPLKPVIIVHDIPKGEAAGFIENPLYDITLNVPEPTGDPPLAQRFRGTDLVWHNWRDTKNKERLEKGFIVLLSSENSPPDDTNIPIQYETKILQRFTLDGNPCGDPLFINDICKMYLNDLIEKKPDSFDHRTLTHIKEIAALLDTGNWENVNWEGLGWFERGKSLIAVYDRWPKDPPFALVIPIPEEWR